MKSCVHFLKAFDTFYLLLMNRDVIKRIAYEEGENCYKDNEKYCEIRFAPVLQAKDDYFY